MSLSEVLRKYFDGASEDEVAHRIGTDIDQRISDGEGEVWVAEEACRLEQEAEHVHEGGDDTF
jgi:hypothetical protein